MTNEQITQALKDALVYDAFMQQLSAPFEDEDNSSMINNVDNCSLLLAVATGKAFSYSEIYNYVYTR